MRIKRFRAENFRNIEGCDIEFNSGVNLLYGNNAQGKTNAIEGIYVFARGKSFRASEDKELIRFGAEGFRIFIEYEDKSGINTLEYALFGRERRRKKNGYKIDKIRDMIGSFKAVLFYPDDLGLIKDSPDKRRDFLNIAISQCYNSYIGYYANYKKALENRNCLLKQASKGNPCDDNELISWSHYMAENAAFINIMRREYSERLAIYVKKIINEISDGKENIELIYKSDVDNSFKSIKEIEEEYKRRLTSNLEKEKIVGSSLYGVHRDDLIINVNGNSARLYASQGQQRSIVLALKLAEGEVNREICGEYPVFLFDDVLSELDEKRKKYILDGIGERQIIITSCEKDTEGMNALRKIEVSSGLYSYK